MANKLTKKAIFGQVQLAKYISTSMTLRYDTSGPSNYSPFHKDEISHFSHQVNGQSLANLKGMLYPYKNVLKFS